MLWKLMVEQIQGLENILEPRILEKIKEKDIEDYMRICIHNCPNQDMLE